LENENVLLVRPSSNNLHTFVAEEDSCFFDICLPNYTTDSLRRITYFNENPENTSEEGEEDEAAQAEVDYGLNTSNITKIQYNVTPPKFPIGFEINELDYRGDFKEFGKYF